VRIHFGMIFGASIKEIHDKHADELTTYARSLVAEADQVSKDDFVAGLALEGKIYAVPHKLDSSVLFYNKDLFKKAGLDAEKPPKNFAEILDYSKKITALGGGVTGFDIAGSCGGCNVYTLFPYAWAAGVKVLSDDGKKVDINNDAFKAVFGLYKQLTDEKLVASSDKTQDGSTWPNNFLGGKVGMLALGSPIVGALNDQKIFEWGVAPLMAPDGSKTSTFVGGDVAGISVSSKHKAQAWDFLKWTLDENATRQIARAFSGYNSLSMTFEKCSVEVDGEAAVARCKVAQRIDVKVGSDIRSTQNVTFELKKSGERWLIRSRTAK